MNDIKQTFCSWDVKEENSQSFINISTEHKQFFKARIIIWKRLQGIFRIELMASSLTNWLIK